MADHSSLYAGIQAFAQWVTPGGWSLPNGSDALVARICRETALPKPRGDAGLFVVGESGPMRALAGAAEAILTGACELAFCFASERVEDDVHCAALVLSSSRWPASAYLRSAVGTTQATSAADLLATACERAQVRPGDITQLAASLDTLTELAAAMTRGTLHPPHCHLHPVSPTLSPCGILASIGLLFQAVRDRTLLPTSIEMPDVPSPFCLRRTLQPWLDLSPRRAAVVLSSSASSGAIILEQAPAAVVAAPFQRSWPHELFLFSGRNPQELAVRLKQALSAGSPLTQLALSQKNDPTAVCRASVVARDSAALEHGVQRLLKHIASGRGGFVQTPDGACCNLESKTTKTAVLFPGHGAQYPGMLGSLCLHFPEFADLLEQLHACFDEHAACPLPSLVSPPSNPIGARHQRKRDEELWRGGGTALSVVGSLGMYALARRAGLSPAAMVGCSIGEHAALAASGCWRIGSQRQFLDAMVKVRRVAEPFAPEWSPDPTTLTVVVNRAPRDLVAQILHDSKGKIHLSLDNCPSQLVLFGEALVLDSELPRLESQGAICVKLPLHQGHHSPAFLPVLARLGGLYKEFEYGKAQVPLYSCTTLNPYPSDSSDARELAKRQWVSPVRFRELTETLFGQGIGAFFELGPGGHTTSFIHNTLQGRSYTACASNLQGHDELRQFLRMLGQAFAAGHNIEYPRLRTPQPGPLLDSILAGQVHQQVKPGALRERAIAALTRTRFPSTTRTPPAGSLLNGRIEHRERGVTIAHHFDAHSHILLAHHRFRRLPFPYPTKVPGLAVVPFTISMEILADAACHASGNRPFILRNQRALRWIAADRETVSLEADVVLAKDAGQANVRIFQLSGQDSGHRDAAFEGEVCFDSTASPVAAQVKLGPSCHIEMTAEQFNARMFHGPSYLTIAKIVSAHDDGVVARVRLPSTAASGRLHVPAVVLDSVGQLVAYWLLNRGYEHFNVFPVMAESYAQLRRPRPGAELTIRIHIELVGSILRANASILDADGQLVASVTGWKMKFYRLPRQVWRYLFEGNPPLRFSSQAGSSRHVSSEIAAFLETEQRIWMRALGHAVLSPLERTDWYKLPDADQGAWLLQRLLAKEKALDVLGSIPRDEDMGDLEVSGTGPLLTVHARHSDRQAASIRVQITAGTHGLTAAVGADVPAPAPLAAVFANRADAPTV